MGEDISICDRTVGAQSGAIDCRTGSFHQDRKPETVQKRSVTPLGASAGIVPDESLAAKGWVRLERKGAYGLRCYHARLIRLPRCT